MSKSQITKKDKKWIFYRSFSPTLLLQVPFPLCSFAICLGDGNFLCKQTDSYFTIVSSEEYPQPPSLDDILTELHAKNSGNTTHIDT